MSTAIRVATLACEHPWAILPEKLAVIRELLQVRVAGERFTRDEISTYGGRRLRLRTVASS